MVKKHVVIIGGGFGGVKAAEELAKENHYKITLISDRANFRYYPSLYRTATGAPVSLSSIPLSRIFHGTRVGTIISKAEKLDRKNKTVHLANGQKVEYDELVLALGVITNYFGIDGLQEYSFGIKSIEEVEELKAHIHRQLLDERKPDLNYVVVGGGPTGIELAGQLPGYLHEVMRRHGLPQRRVHVDLIEGSPHLLPRMPKAIGRAIEKQLRKIGVKLYLGKMVEGETADKLLIKGRPIRSHTVIWTAGQANSPFFSNNEFKLSEHHKVVVNEFLEAEPHIHVIGDNADTKYSGLAQTALYDAEFIAHDLTLQAEDRPRIHYRPRKPIYVLPAGPRWAAVEWHRLHFYGWLGWFLREAADVRGFLDLEPTLQAGEQWLKEFSNEESCAICAANGD